MYGLKELRMIRKVPVTRILNALGISRTQYWNIENKRAIITPNQKAKLAELFMVKADSIKW